MSQITEANFARLLATLNNDAPIAAVDFETFYSKVCSVRELGAWAYCQHPDWDCYLVAVTRKSKEGIPLPTYVGDPKLFPWAELAGYRLYSHNAMFDMTVYRRMVELGQVIDIEPLIEGWDCTADFSAYACNRRSLKDAVKFFFKRELSKKVRDDALGKRWPTDFTAEQQADMLAYGGDDSDECYSIAELAQKQWPDKERLLSRLTRLQGMRGVQLDMAKLDLMLRACRNREVELLNIIPWAKEGKPVTSPKATAEFCRANGVMPPPVKAREGEETFIKWEEAVAALAERSVTDWLAAQPTLVEGGPAPVDFLLKYVLIGAMADALPATAPWFGSTAVSEVMRALADYRSITKFAKQLETLKERSDDNGIYRFSLKTFGAHCVTGDHEVLTPDGWVKISDWTGGSLAQYHHDGSGKIEFLPATANRFEVKGERLLALDAPFVKARMTLGHTVPYLTHSSFKPATLKAGDLPSRASLYLPVSGRLAAGGSITEAQMRVLVAVQADGHWPKDRNVVQFCLRKERKVVRVRKLLSDAGLPFFESEFKSTPGQKRIEVRNPPAWLARERKSFGPWLLDATREAMDAFCEEVSKWDGHEYKSGDARREYYSLPRCNHEWVATMLHLSGKAAGRICGSTDRRGFTTCLRDASYAMTTPSKDAVLGEPQDTTVYCPTTKTGFWMVRYSGSISITGNTGRFSGDAGFNMQNITKADSGSPDAFWIVTADGDDSRILHGGVIRSDVFPEFHEARKDPAVRKKIVFCAGGLKFTLLDMRSLFIARPGRKLVIADSSQIEPRCLAFLTKDRAFIELVKQGIDIYEAHARTMHGFTGPKGHLKYLANVLKDSAAMTLRARSKAERLGLGYQAGPVGYQRAAAMLAGLALSLEEALDAVRRYREANPHVTGFWARLQTALASSVGRDLRLKLPSGRFMSYRNVAEERVMVVDKETGKPKWKSQLTADIDGRRYGFYGGALCENIVQGTARDVFIEYALALWDESLGRALDSGLSGWDALVESLVEAPLWTVHDELICESPDNRVDAHLKEVEHVMNSTPVWAGDTPFACEGLVSPHYLK